MKLGDRLKQFRKKLDLHVDDIAKKLGINRVSYYKYEEGERLPRIEILEKLANAYNISLNYLILGKGDEFFHEDLTVRYSKLFGENEAKIRDLLFYMKNSDFVQHRMLSYFLQVKHENRDLIQSEIEAGEP